jgi:hypothetical protein
VEIKKQRRTNKIQGFADQPFEDQSPTMNELIYAFRLDCKNRNLAQRTIAYYEDCLHYLQNMFAEQKRSLEVW